MTAADSSELAALLERGPPRSTWRTGSTSTSPKRPITGRSSVSSRKRRSGTSTRARRTTTRGRPAKTKTAPRRPR